MIAAILTRLGAKGLAWLAIAAGVLIAATWFGAKMYLAGVYAERVKTLEATIEQIRADLAANEEVIKKAEADAADAEKEEQKLKELINALRNDKSCPLSREHVDGVRRIDQGP